MLEKTSHSAENHRFIGVLFRRKLVIFGMIIILLTSITAIFAPWLAPYNPYETDLTQTVLQPCKEHLLGTDALGRDTLSRIIYGSRTSLLVGIVAIGIAASIGMTLGLVAGYFGGIISAIIMRSIDALMSFPMLLLALVIASVLGSGLTNVMLAIGISLVTIYTRLMYSQVITVKENDYITAAHVVGGSSFRIMISHVVPNCLPALIVLITMNMGMAILSEASLSFLGIGIAPPGAAWGNMVSTGSKRLTISPILSIAPGLAIMVVVFAFNMVGDGLRDALDPRLRGTL